MWGSVVGTVIMSVLTLLLLHCIYKHLQTTLTVPKVADLVRKPEQKYAEIETILKTPDMKHELNDFLKSLRPA